MSALRGADTVNDLRAFSETPFSGEKGSVPPVTSNLRVDATPSSQRTENIIEAAKGLNDSRDGVQPTRSPLDWRRSYARRLFVTDFAILIWVVYAAQIAWFGAGWATVAAAQDGRISDLSYWVFSAVLVLAWMWALSFTDSRSARVVGTGSQEYIRVATSSFRLFGVVAIIAFLTKTDVARGYLLISLPLGIVTLVLGRWVWRQWLIMKRGRGEFSARVLLVGSLDSAAQVARELQRNPTAGYQVVGACVPPNAIAAALPGTEVPIIGSVDAVRGSIAATGADTVAVTSTDELPPDKVKEISWGLEAGRQHLVLAPSIVDIAGPRIHVRPVAGLSLMHVETPRFTRGQAFAKRAFDLFATTVIAIVLSPVLVAVALGVKLSSPGPVLYRQERVGLRGEPFQMMKFRSMRVGADKELAALLAAQGTSTTPLFKISNDPRITPIGRVIRRFSLDELPQLFNVLGGSMSLVGPRPQIAAEVALYDEAARRRLLARPGITGLWQVSGRSSLHWEETVRLDLFYVENWSFLGDIAILIRTARAVLSPGDTAH
jgi:exopolysaccharide biosynthesis polyprenyl glycosylphosphotransferase